MTEETDREVNAEKTSTEIIYLKGEQSAYLNKKKVQVKDFCEVYCFNKEIEKFVKNVVVREFQEGEKEDKIILSVIDIIRAVEENLGKEMGPLEVKNIGEQDFIIYFKSQKTKKKGVQYLKVMLVGFTCFLGSGFTIMGYNNDVDASKTFGQLYHFFRGVKPHGPTWMELVYSFGLAVGIYIFFRQMPGKKVTDEPSPIEVQMRLYEMNVNDTYIINDSREKNNKNKE